MFVILCRNFLLIVPFALAACQREGREVSVAPACTPKPDKPCTKPPAIETDPTKDDTGGSGGGGDATGGGITGETGGVTAGGGIGTDGSGSGATGGAGITTGGGDPSSTSGSGSDSGTTAGSSGNGGVDQTGGSPGQQGGAPDQQGSSPGQSNSTPDTGNAPPGNSNGNGSSLPTIPPGGVSPLTANDGEITNLGLKISSNKNGKLNVNLGDKNPHKITSVSLQLMGVVRPDQGQSSQGPGKPSGTSNSADSASPSSKPPSPAPGSGPGSASFVGIAGKQELRVLLKFNTEKQTCAATAVLPQNSSESVALESRCK